MFDFPIQDYDVIVCGAGPAGLKTAYDLLHLSKGAYSILLLDRKLPWKEPVICAEAVSTDAFQKYWPVKECFVRGTISGIYFVSPNGSKAEFYSKDCGLQLNRAEFHKDLFEGAKSLGLHFDFSTRCVKIERSMAASEKSLPMWSLHIEKNGEKAVVRAKVIVDATGPGDMLTHSVAELTELENGKTDLEPAVFAIAEGIPHSREHIELYFGTPFSGGYGWVFPRDGIEVNVGLVLGKEERAKNSPRRLLETFLAERFPQAKIKGFYGGMIACGQSERPLAKNGVFKAGDAASCTNPISRSGIVEALKSGTCTAASVLEWLAASTETERRAAERAAFERWYKIQGKTHSRIAKAKKAFNALSDAKLNKAAGRLEKLTREKSTLFRIFFEVLASSPSLIWKMRSFLKG